ncbi:MAG: guanylate kinase [Chloroflexi bacterium]|nr:guanylate kinase [Chloroflexota bacterium]MBI2976855.1 guanylate kinase [Chloroflexota bacterium]MBI3176728.1 guanylate kinase [Chloroflexota bacterium]MBI5293331.1 guanylate kinase [Chloroflexota bacterium]MBI5830624.1 guanylate kinase [Chloroflexota bacterium]
MSEPFFERQRYPLLIVISGPSGVGKDAVLQRMKERGVPMHFVVTATTRAPRPGEADGVDYFFVSNDTFAEMIERNDLLEYAIVYNDYKGIPKQQVREALASGHDVILRIDVQGAATIRKICPDALLIFMTTGSEEELVQRLTARKTETPEGLKLRIATARRELQRLTEFDYCIVNPEFHLESAVDALLAVIEAEHNRVKPRLVTL